MDGKKGVYHINAVGEVTQWEVAGATPRVSEAYLEPLLEQMMRQFPFRILGFHTDNGFGVHQPHRGSPRTPYDNSGTMQNTVPLAFSSSFP